MYILPYIPFLRKENKMKVQPISNNQPKQQTVFKADFTRKEVTKMLEVVAERNNPEGLPQLYTLLKFVKNFSGKLAELKTGVFSNITFLTIDNNKVLGHCFEKNPLFALKNICVQNGQAGRSRADFTRMSESVFKNECQKNRNVTEKQIMELSV